MKKNFDEDESVLNLNVIFNRITYPLEENNQNIL
jgi:hypothetical protein